MERSEKHRMEREDSLQMGVDTQACYRNNTVGIVNHIIRYLNSKYVYLLKL